MDTTGQHYLVEYYGCACQLLDNVQHVAQSLRQAAEAAGATIVATSFHRFAPQGVSGVVLVEESHLSIHTWPERGYAAVDFYTCGECAPDRAYDLLKERLGAERAEVMVVQRGGLPRDPSMKVKQHFRENSATDDKAELSSHERVVHRDV